MSYMIGTERWSCGGDGTTIDGSFGCFVSSSGATDVSVCVVGGDKCLDNSGGGGVATTAIAATVVVGTACTDISIRRR